MVRSGEQLKSRRPNLGKAAKELWRDIKPRKRTVGALALSMAMAFAGANADKSDAAAHKKKVNIDCVSKELFVDSQLKGHRESCDFKVRDRRGRFILKKTQITTQLRHESQADSKTTIDDVTTVKITRLDKEGAVTLRRNSFAMKRYIFDTDKASQYAPGLPIAVNTAESSDSDGIQGGIEVAPMEAICKGVTTDGRIDEQFCDESMYQASEACAQEGGEWHNATPIAPPICIQPALARSESL